MNHLSPETHFAILEAMLNGSQVATVVTDPQQFDNPIIYTNRTFENLTGYTREEVIGRNCRFLQGGETDDKMVHQIREAIAKKQQTTVIIRNFRKDGTPFWNRLHIEPLTIEEQLFFIGTQTDVSTEEQQRFLLEEKEEEINRLLLPILPLRENLGAVSLVGKMTDDRFSVLTTKLSEYVQANATHHMIIDISGAIWEDKFLMARLMMIQDVLRLMGGKLYITGISPKTAIDIVDLQEPNQTLLTFSTVQLAIDFIDQHEPF